MLLLALAVVLTWAFFPSIGGRSVRAAQTQEIALSRTSVKMLKGTKTTLKLLNTNGTVHWATTSKAYAEVSAGGVITAKKAGTVTIAAFHDGVCYTCRVTIEDPKISVSQMTLIKGQKRTVKLNGTTQKLKWSSSNAAVASVSAAGAITANKTGTAVISATVYGRKFSCKVKVETPSLRGNTQAVTWSSNKSSVAVVSSKGVITAKGAGTATITATVGGRKYSCSVTVPQPVTGVAGNYEKLLTEIKKKGGRDSKGFLALMESGTLDDGIKYFTELAYNPSNKKFVFKTRLQVESDGQTIQVETRLIFTDRTYKTAIAQVDMTMPAYNNAGFGIRTRFSTSSYTTKNKLKFNVVMKTNSNILDGISNSELQEMGNTYLQFSFNTWAYLLKQNKTNLTLKNLGFMSYR